MDGTERRMTHRRQSDVCPFHDICFDQQAEKWKEHNKEHETMWQSIENKLPRWVFVLIIAASISILGSGFYHFGSAQSKQAETLQQIAIGLEVLKQQHEAK